MLGDGIDLGRHPLSPAPSASAADWWVRSTGDADRSLVASAMPSVLPTVVLVLHPWWSYGDDRRCTWREVVATTEDWDSADLADAVLDARLGDMNGVMSPPVPEALPTDVAHALVSHLRCATSAPGACYFGLNPARGEGLAQRHGAAFLDAEDGWDLLVGPVEAAVVPLESGYALPGVQLTGIWWASDASWILRTPDHGLWTFVAGSEQLTRGLADDDRLEVVRTRFHADLRNPLR